MYCILCAIIIAICNWSKVNWSLLFFNTQMSKLGVFNSCAPCWYRVFPIATTIITEEWVGSIFTSCRYNQLNIFRVVLVSFRLLPFAGRESAMILKFITSRTIAQRLHPRTSFTRPRGAKCEISSRPIESPSRRRPTEE